MTKAKMFNHLKKINCPIDKATFLKMKKKEYEDYYFNYHCTYIRSKKNSYIFLNIWLILVEIIKKLFQENVNFLLQIWKF